jgi:hypothetical protein
MSNDDVDDVIAAVEATVNDYRVSASVGFSAGWQGDGS